MSRRIDIFIGLRQEPGRDTDRNVRMTWGLSSRLPRWRMFDGRQSRVAPLWATTNRREIARTVAALMLALAVGAAFTVRTRDVQVRDARPIGFAEWAQR